MMFLAFSALIMSPDNISKYPSKEVEAQRVFIHKKEVRLNEMINEIEFNLNENKIKLSSQKLIYIKR